MIIEDFLIDLSNAYPKHSFYVVKSDKANKYHIFCNELIFKNMNELKYDIKQKLPKAGIDMAVYGKTQLLRLPF